MAKPTVSFNYISDDWTVSSNGTLYTMSPSAGAHCVRFGAIVSVSFSKSSYSWQGLHVPIFKVSIDSATSNNTALPMNLAIREDKFLDFGTRYRGELNALSFSFFLWESWTLELFVGFA